MNERSSSRIYPLIYPSLNGLQHNEDIFTFPSANPLTTSISTDYTPVYSQSGSLGCQSRPTWQINPPQHKPSNISTSSNFGTAPSSTGNTSGQNKSDALDDQHKPPNTSTPLNSKAVPISTGETCGNTQSNSITTPISTSNDNIRMVSIIAIGNPGAGKSTMLNSLAGEILFKSGVSIGDGLTYQLEERMNERGKFFDTPGLADDALREAAARAISTALRKGGPFKILFFVRLESGRIIREDITTIKLVLDSAPEMGNKYGIVTNKLPEEVAELLRDHNQAEKLLIKLFASIPEERRCPLTSITYLPYRREADSKNNHLLHPSSVITPEGSYFEDFVYGRIETVQLTEDRANDIKAGNFDDVTKIIEVLEKKLEENKEMLMDQQRWMRQQMENAEKELQRKDEELSVYHERDRTKLQRKKEACIVM